MKLCKDCKHYRASDEQCLRSDRGPNLVTGESLGHYLAQTERAWDVQTGCGPSGRRGFAEGIPGSTAPMSRGSTAPGRMARR